MRFLRWITHLLRWSPVHDLRGLPSGGWYCVVPGCGFAMRARDARPR